MFFKTVVASIIAALLAGGVIYFGLPADPSATGSVSLRTHQQTGPNTPQNSNRAKPNNEAPPPAMPPSAPKPEERWIDRFVTGPLRRTIRPEPSRQRDNLGLQKSEPKSWDYTEAMPQNNSANNNAINNTETPAKPTPSESVPTPTPRPQEQPQQTAKPESDAPRYYVLENGELREIEELPVPKLPEPRLEDALNPDASFRILTVSEQAKQIKQPDLRDRAFLDIVDYALTKSLFSASISAMEEIKQVELRDTARSRIAIAYARAGDSRAAFALIDEVEVEELQDVLRLQVIESMILPERLPDGL